MATGNLLLKQSGKIPVAIPRFLPSKQKKKHGYSIRRGLVFLWCFCHFLFLNGNFVMVDSPRFPKSSGIDPKKALVLTTAEFPIFLLIPACLSDWSFSQYCRCPKL